MNASAELGKLMEVPNFEPTFFTVADMVAVNAGSRPRDIAWIEGECQVSWRSFDQQLNQLARALQQNGVAKGDRIALLGGNSFWSYLVGFASMRAGGVICPLSSLLTAELLVVLLVDCRATLLFVDRDYLALAQQVQALLPELQLVYIGEGVDGVESFSDFIAASSDAPLWVELSAEAPANIIYSSGTTGTPKGIVHSHGARIGFLHQLGHGCRFTNQSRVLVSTAPNSNATWMMIFPAIWLGATVVTMGTFEVPKLLQQVAQHDISHMFIVPTQARAMTEYEQAGDADVSSLRCVVTAGAPMPVPLKDAMRELIGEKLFELWGFSESVGTLIAPEEMRLRPESVGRAWTGTELRIIDQAGRDITGRGAGEVVGRTTSTMAGYLNRADANDEIQWRDEYGRRYLRTGDIGELDEDGYLTLRGRSKDIILSGGLNVFPVDIEKVMLDHPAVADVAVFPVKEEKWGETPVAAVIVAAGQAVEVEQLKAWTNQRLAKFQRIADVVVYREDFPRNTMGKVLKNLLQQTYTEKL